VPSKKGQRAVARPASAEFTSRQTRPPSARDSFLHFGHCFLVDAPNRLKGSTAPRDPSLPAFQMTYPCAPSPQSFSSLVTADLSGSKYIIPTMPSFVPYFALFPHRMTGCILNCPIHGLVALPYHVTLCALIV